MTDFLSTIPLYLPGIISFLFILIGLTFILIHLHFLRNGKKSKAKLIGYKEELQTMTSSGNSRRKTKRLMYTALYKFSHRGKDFKSFASGSSSTMSSKIGSRQDIYIINNNPNLFRFKNSYEFYFGFLFLIIGSIIYYLMFLKNISTLNSVISSISFLIFYYYLFNLYFKRKKGTMKDAITKLLHKDHATEEELSKSKLYMTSDEVEKFHVKHSLVGVLICFFFIGFMSVVLYLVWNDVSSQVREQAINLLSNPIENAQLIKNEFSKGNRFIITLAFCGSMLSIILIPTLKQMSLFLRR